MTLFQNWILCTAQFVSWQAVYIPSSESRPDPQSWYFKLQSTLNPRAKTNISSKENYDFSNLSQSSSVGQFDCVPGIIILSSESRPEPQSWYFKLQSVSLRNCMHAFGAIFILVMKKIPHDHKVPNMRNKIKKCISEDQWWHWLCLWWWYCLWWWSWFIYNRSCLSPTKKLTSSLICSAMVAGEIYI